MKSKTTGVSISPPLSFELWNLWEYLKGRKRAIVAIVATGILYLVTDEVLASLIGGVVVEGVFSIVDFYLTKVKVPQ